MIIKNTQPKTMSGVLRQRRQKQQLTMRYFPNQVPQLFSQLFNSWHSEKYGLYFCIQVQQYIYTSSNYLIIKAINDEWTRLWLVSLLRHCLHLFSVVSHDILTGHNMFFSSFSFSCNCNCNCKSQKTKVCSVYDISKIAIDLCVV